MGSSSEELESNYDGGTVMERETCENCAHSELTNQTQCHGAVLCKRYPPVIVVGEMGMQLEFSAWPTVLRNAHCGEWQTGPAGTTE